MRISLRHFKKTEVLELYIKQYIYQTQYLLTYYKIKVHIESRLLKGNIVR